MHRTFLTARNILAPLVIACVAGIAGGLGAQVVLPHIVSLAERLTPGPGLRWWHGISEETRSAAAREGLRLNGEHPAFNAIYTAGPRPQITVQTERGSLPFFLVAAHAALPAWWRQASVTYIFAPPRFDPDERVAVVIARSGRTDYARIVLLDRPVAITYAARADMAEGQPLGSLTGLRLPASLPTATGDRFDAFATQVRSNVLVEDRGPLFGLLAIALVLLAALWTLVAAAWITSIHLREVALAPTAVAAALFAVGTIVALPFVPAIGEREQWDATMFTIGAIAAAWGVLMSDTFNDDAAAARSALRQLDTETDERGRDLHDLGQALLHQAARPLTALRAGPGALHDALISTADALTHAQRFFRSLVWGTASDRVPADEHELEARIIEFTAARGLAGHVVGSPGKLPFEVRRTVEALCAEAVTNVGRHAPDARQVEITFQRAGRELRLTIEDDGHGGSSTSEAKSSGLAGIKRRASRAGGTVEAQGGRNGGKLIEAHFPRAGSSGFVRALTKMDMRERITRTIIPAAICALIVKSCLNWFDHGLTAISGGLLAAAVLAVALAWLLMDALEEDSVPPFGFTLRQHNAYWAERSLARHARRALEEFGALLEEAVVQPVAELAEQAGEIARQGDRPIHDRMHKAACLQAEITGALADRVQRISRDMDSLGHGRSLDGALRDVARRSALAVRLLPPVRVPTCEAAVATSLYLLAERALEDAHRLGCTEATLTLSRDGRDLRLKVLARTAAADDVHFAYRRHGRGYPDYWRMTDWRLDLPAARVVIQSGSVSVIVKHGVLTVDGYVPDALPDALRVLVIDPRRDGRARATTALAATEGYDVLSAADLDLGLHFARAWGLDVDLVVAEPRDVRERVRAELGRAVRVVGLAEIIGNHETGGKHGAGNHLR